MTTNSRFFDSPGSMLIKIAGLLSITAAFIHSYVIPEHLSEWWGYGAFFIAAIVLQALYGIVVLMQPWRFDKDGTRRISSADYERPLYLLGIFGNLAVMGLYVVTRTVGIPLFGPEAGKVEPVTVIGLLSKTTEALTIVCLIQLYRKAKS